MLSVPGVLGAGAFSEYAIETLLSPSRGQGGQEQAGEVLRHHEPTTQPKAPRVGGCLKLEGCSDGTDLIGVDMIQLDLVAVGLVAGDESLTGALRLMSLRVRAGSRSDVELLCFSCV